MSDLPDWKSLTAAEKRKIFEPAWMNGASAGEIALSCFSNATRNAVIGAISRAKLTGRIVKPPHTRTAKPKPSPVTVKRRARKPIPAQPGTPPLMVDIPEPDAPTETIMQMIAGNRPPLAGTTPIDIMALPKRPGVLCRFPVDGGYCGVACGEKMYCQTHHAIMYRPTERLRMPKDARR